MTIMMRRHRGANGDLLGAPRTFLVHSNELDRFRGALKGFQFSA
jgi:hypothetical protein